ncbi:Zinc finger BED domain-containing protein 5 [Araneus ventricosus]|uniref:Zinc finger BED domain-containing protein 5 n=1 Tax=Araneus ventricosus TaxID=182803 RepID=A0A4Y2LYK7_ARAVE|nr:Zinc finger BED domain-containing protein 5 [Araneus ventricosus]
MLENVKKAVMTGLKRNEYFSLHPEESRDVASQANLLTFGTFEFNGNIEEDILFYQLFPTKTTDEEIFKCINNYIKENEVYWSKCVCLTTDCALAMSGINIGLVAKVKTVAPLAQWTYCSIYIEALAVKGLDKCLTKTLEDAVKSGNFIKVRLKNSRLFGVLCDEMGSEHKLHLFDCEVRWIVER